MKFEKGAISGDTGHPGRRAGTMIVSWLFFTSFLGAQSAPAKVRQGNQQYEQKNYEQALRQYSEALAVDPDRSEIRYNLGNTLHRLGKHQEAAMELKKASGSGNRSLQAQSHYNLGNVLFQTGDYRGAVSEFSSALKLNGSDQDAKYNLEFALRKLEEEKQKQSQDKNNRSQKDPGEKEQQQGKNESPEKSQEQKDLSKKEDSEQKERSQNSNDPKQSSTGKEKEKQPAASQPGQPASPQQWKNISPQEAEQLLRAMEAKEAQELQRQQLLLRPKQGRERDW